MSGFCDIERAIADIAAGKPVVVVDDADRENEGDLIFAAEMATPELVAFMVRYTSGYICVPLTEADCDRLDLPPMYHTNQDRRGTAYTVSVDARDGTSTGISAHDRALTMRLLADPASTAADFTRPGHVVPLRAKAGGVLRRPGHTEAAVDLCRMAGLQPGRRAVRDRQREGRRGHGAARRARAVRRRVHDLALISIADLIAYRRRTETPDRAGRRGPDPDQRTATSAPSATAARSTTSSTSRWCAATSVTARTSWSGCTPSA